MTSIARASSRERNGHFIWELWEELDPWDLSARVAANLKLLRADGTLPPELDDSNPNLDQKERAFINLDYAIRVQLLFARNAIIEQEIDNSPAALLYLSEISVNNLKKQCAALGEVKMQVRTLPSLYALALYYLGYFCKYTGELDAYLSGIFWFLQARETLRELNDIRRQRFIHEQLIRFGLSFLKGIARPAPPAKRIFWDTTIRITVQTLVLEWMRQYVRYYQHTDIAQNGPPMERIFDLLVEPENIENEKDFRLDFFRKARADLNSARAIRAASVEATEEKNQEFWLLEGTSWIEFKRIINAELELSPLWPLNKRHIEQVELIFHRPQNPPQG